MTTLVIQPRNNIITIDLENKMAIVLEPMVEGQVEQLYLDWSEEGTPSASAVAIYYEGDDLTGDLSSTLLSGSESISGNTVTTKLLTVGAGDGGKRYRMINSATIGSRVIKQAIVIPIERPQG